MPFRNVIVESPAHITVKNSQLIIKTDREHALAVEDISSILFESRQSTITTAALSVLGQCGCAVYLCDEKHMPCAVLEPFSQYVRTPHILDLQTGMSEPLRKRLWQSIVKAKIGNQALCLSFSGKSGADALKKMASEVLSGDTGNAEATAARRYFLSLFDLEFTRDAENGYNAALNYGYAILRGCAARYLAAYGFMPALGLQHRSMVNSFNLADDIMEPFRPVIDLLVSNYFDGDELTPDKKRLLFNSLNLDVLSGGQHHTVAYAMERLVQSLTRSLEEGKAQLLLPELTELKQHSYE